jgi:hypothetical protein
VDLEQRGVVKARQQAGLVDKGLQAQRKGLGIGLRAQRDVHGLGAAGQRGGHVFLDRHLALQRVVEGQVDNAETAHAQDLEQFELAQPRTNGQGARGVDALA